MKQKKLKTLFMMLRRVSQEHFSGIYQVNIINIACLRWISGFFKGNSFNWRFRKIPRWIVFFRTFNWCFLLCFSSNIRCFITLECLGDHEKVRMENEKVSIFQKSFYLIFYRLFFSKLLFSKTMIDMKFSFSGYIN